MRFFATAKKRQILPYTMLKRPESEVKKFTLQDYAEYKQRVDTFDSEDPTWTSAVPTPDEIRFEIERLNRIKAQGYMLSEREEQVLEDMTQDIAEMEAKQKQLEMSKAHPKLPSGLLLYHGAGQLLQKSVHVDMDKELHTPGFKQKLRQMQDEYTDHKGIGFAAPQIGWQRRIIMFGHQFDDAEMRQQPPEVQEQLRDMPFQIWINPLLLQVSKKQCWYWEGCLSAPGIRAWISRPAKCIVGGFDEFGNQREAVTLTGLAARTFQHEFDHLEGILFTSRCNKADYIVPENSFLGQQDNSWPLDWPSRGARLTNPIRFSDME